MKVRPKVWTSRSKTASPPKLRKKKNGTKSNSEVSKDMGVLEPVTEVWKGNKSDLLEPVTEAWESYKTDQLTITTTQRTEKKKSIRTHRSKDIPMNVTISFSDEDNAGKIVMLSLQSV